MDSTHEIALLSDAHSEAAAVAAVLQAMAQQGLRRAWCLGDSVDWLLPRDPALRGDPAALRLLRASCELVLSGNHESELLASPDGQARLAAEPDGAELLAYLRSLTTLVERDGLVLVHGSLTEPTWGAVETAGDAAATFAKTDARLILCGHTHLPFLASIDDAGRVEDHRLPARGAEQLLAPDRRWLINPGSVGRAPLDGIASWAVLRRDEHGNPLAVRWQLTGFALSPRLSR